MLIVIISAEKVNLRLGKIHYSQLILPSFYLILHHKLTNNITLRWGDALVNPADVTVSSFIYLILPISLRFQ